MITCVYYTLNKNSLVVIKKGTAKQSRINQTSLFNMTDKNKDWYQVAAKWMQYYPFSLYLAIAI